MEKQNVTLSLPKALLKSAKAIAAGKDKSLSELLRESLEERIRKETGYRQAKAKQIALLQKGFDLGTRGSMGISREDLHAR